VLIKHPDVEDMDAEEMVRQGFSTVQQRVDDLLSKYDDQEEEEEIVKGKLGTAHLALGRTRSTDSSLNSSLSNWSLSQQQRFRDDGDSAFYAAGDEKEDDACTAFFGRDLRLLESFFDRSFFD
jgi:hypothetical protein